MSDQVGNQNVGFLMTQLILQILDQYDKFTEYDKNGDGSLDLTEVVKVVQYLGFTFNAHQLQVCITWILIQLYCKIPKFSDASKLCCNLPKIQTKRPNLRSFHQKDANGIANSADPDQTAPLGAV